MWDLLRKEQQRAIESFSRSAFDFGSIAIEMTGSGKFIFSRRRGWSSEQRVSPVLVYFRPMHSSDVSCEEFVAVFALVRVHFEQAGNALSLIFCRIEQAIRPWSKFRYKSG